MERVYNERGAEMKIETIELNGKKYVLESDMLSELENNNPPKSPSPITLISKEILIDESKVLGVGTVILSNNYVCVSLGTEYIEKIIRGLKAISSSKNGLDKVDICVTQDGPCIFGRLGEKNMASGFILAPRVEND